MKKSLLVLFALTAASIFTANMATATATATKVTKAWSCETDNIGDCQFQTTCPNENDTKICYLRYEESLHKNITECRCESN